MKKYIFLGIIFVAIIAIGSLFYFNMDSTMSYITISINPEVELMLDKNDKVVDYLALNEDADILMSDLDVIGLNVIEATDLIIDSAALAGYIDEYSTENAIIVKTMNDSEEDRLKLEEKVMTNIKEKLENRKIYAVIAAVKLSDELKEEADSLEISNGKMLLIERAVSLNDTLVKKDLSEMTIKEIQNLIKIGVKKRHDAISTKKEELKTLWQDKKEELKSNYRESVDAIKEEFKEKVANYQDLTPKEKAEAIKEAIKNKKEELEDKLIEVKEEVKEYIESGKYNSVTEDAIENFRSIIRNRGN